MDKPQALELLAPARTCAIARQAILHGADAVYIGGPDHGARAAASNSVAEIAGLCTFAHTYRARVYVTLNTIIFDSELDGVRRIATDLYRAGVDALIVQDMALLRLDLPPIALHASTQCDTRTPQKARFLAECGFSQVVIARECSEQEIKDIRAAMPPSVAIEAFVHGALCVSYSGDCQASFCTSGRSANRGTCAQMCRLAYNLTDSGGNVLARGKHLLSLRDLNRLDDIESMALAGVASFKIEGRLKDEGYVKTVVAAYRREIDRVIALHPDRFVRASQGRSEVSFCPDVKRVFNRRFTSYFYNPDLAATQPMAQTDTPKWVGLPVATVTRSRGKTLDIKASATIANGDGLGYFTPGGTYTGFRVNRAENGRLHTARPVDIAPGTQLYRNSSTEFDAAMARDTATRTLALEMTLRPLPDGRIALRCLTEGGDYAEVADSIGTFPAKSPQKAVRRDILAKSGGTAYALTSITDAVGDNIFIPASALTALRRRAIAALDSQRVASYRYDYRRPENREFPFVSDTLTYHDNVANRLAEAFYRDHGVKTMARALECASPSAVAPGTVVMTTRYCLRRELGACLRTPQCKKLPRELYLENGNVRFSLDFDCKNCRMHVRKA